MGADTRCGLTYLSMSDEDQEVALKVLEQVIELRQDQHKNQAAWIARYTWGESEEKK